MYIENYRLPDSITKDALNAALQNKPSHFTERLFMKLYLLEPKKNNKVWKPWYDKAFGFVVRAESEIQARAIAQENAGDEIGHSKTPTPAWTDEKYSTCEELKAEGNAQMILRDLASA